MIQQSHFWVFTQKIWNVCQTDIHTPISTAALFTAAKLWRNLVVHQQLNWWGKCGMDTQGNTTSPWWERKFCHLWPHGCNGNLILSEIVRHGKTNTVWSDLSRESETIRFTATEKKMGLQKLKGEVWRSNDQRIENLSWTEDCVFNLFPIQLIILYT